MRSLVLSIVSLVLVLTACTSNYPLKSVDYNELFSNGNSKVWVINKMIVNDIDVAQAGLRNKEIFVFHDSGVLDYLPLRVIGQKEPKKGRFYLDSDKRIMSINFKKQEWRFKMSVLEDDRIVMRPLKKGSAPFTVELIPLPEL